MELPEGIHLKNEAENITCLLPKNCYNMKKAVLYFNVWERCKSWEQMGVRINKYWRGCIMTTDQRKQTWLQYWCFKIKWVFFFTAGAQHYYFEIKLNMSFITKLHLRLILNEAFQQWLNQRSLQFDSIQIFRMQMNWVKHSSETFAGTFCFAQVQ